MVNYEEMSLREKIYKFIQLWQTASFYELKSLEGVSKEGGKELRYRGALLSQNLSEEAHQIFSEGIAQETIIIRNSKGRAFHPSRFRINTKGLPHDWTWWCYLDVANPKKDCVKMTLEEMAHFVSIYYFGNRRGQDNDL